MHLMQLMMCILPLEKLNHSEYGFPYYFFYAFICIGTAQN